MTAHFMDLMFTPAVKAAQDAHGSRKAYARRQGVSFVPDRLTEAEIAFIGQRDSFYMATVNAAGWPYMQHRGGRQGFVKVLDDRRLGIADFRGNRQYVSLGNLASDDRAALFFMDYPRQARLKLLGHVRAVALEDEPELAARLVDRDYDAKVERGLIITLEAFDWNCPQHITPRYSAAELEPAISRLTARIAELEAELAKLTAKT